MPELKKFMQYAGLRAFYAHTPFPTALQLKQLASEAGLAVKTVRNWFEWERRYERLRVSWFKWYQITFVISMAFSALGIAYVIRGARIVPRQKVLWPMAAHTSTAAVAALFLLTCGFAWVIAWSWSRATIRSMWRHQRHNGALKVFGVDFDVLKARHVRQQQEFVLCFFLWTWANVVFWSVMDPTPSASSP